MKEQPIACSLGAGDLETRQAELTAIGRQSLLSVDRTDGAPVVLDFRRDASTEAALERIVAAEAECCAFLEIKIVKGDLLQMTIEGPAGSEPVIDDLVSAFGSDAGG